MFFCKSKQGFTLVEVLLYIAASAGLFVVISLLLSLLLRSHVKTQIMTEVNQQGLQIMQTILYNIRNAESINSPIPTESGALLSLDVVDGLKDPTVFDLNSFTLQITEGASPAVNLSNSRVLVSGLLFENLSQPETPGTVRVEFQLSSVNPSDRKEYDFSKTFYGSASLH